jgi:hypothetical protein
MSNRIPLEVIDSILEYNNTKLTFNKKTNSYHLKIINYDGYKAISDIYRQLCKRGPSKMVKNANIRPDNTWNYTIWHEFSLPEKWSTREYTLNYTESNKVDDFFYIMYANHKAYYSMRITYNEDKTVDKVETIKHT